MAQLYLPGSDRVQHVEVEAKRRYSHRCDYGANCVFLGRDFYFDLYCHVSLGLSSVVAVWFDNVSTFMYLNRRGELERSTKLDFLVEARRRAALWGLLQR